MDVWEDCETTYATKETNDSGPHAASHHVTTCDSAHRRPVNKLEIYNGVNSASLQFRTGVDIN